jgi:hypothetical protein
MIGQIGATRRDWASQLEHRAGAEAAIDACALEVHKMTSCVLACHTSNRDSLRSLCSRGNAVPHSQVVTVSAGDSRACKERGRRAISP